MESSSINLECVSTAEDKDRKNLAFNQSFYHW